MKIIICPYCKRKHLFDVRYGDKLWERLRPAKAWYAPIFAKGEYTPTVSEKCECGAYFVFAKSEKEAVKALSRRRGRKRLMSVEKTGVSVGEFMAYAIKRLVLIEEYRQTVRGKYESTFRKAVIPSEVLARKGYYAVYNEGDNIILKYTEQQ